MRIWLGLLLAALAQPGSGGDGVSGDIYIQQSLNDLAELTAAHSATWHLDRTTTWSADQDAGQLVFHLPNGTVATTTFQIVGTYYTTDGTFLWGWDHPSVVPALRKHAELARAWGEKHGLKDYTTRKVTCSEEKAWEFTAVAVRLGKANGAYRGVDGPTGRVYMTFGRVTLRKQ